MIHSRRFAGLLLLAFTPSVVLAQQASTSLKALQSQLTTSDKIRVVEQDGKEVQGFFSRVAGASLHITERGIPREFSESTIREVTQQRPDSILTGLLIGAGIGAGAGFGAIASTGGSDSSELLAMMVIVPTAVGGLAGATIDYLIRERRILYSRPQSTHYNLNFFPILTSQNKGIAISLSF